MAELVQVLGERPTAGKHLLIVQLGSRRVNAIHTGLFLVFYDREGFFFLCNSENMKALTTRLGG